MGQPPASSRLDTVNHRERQLSVVSRDIVGALRAELLAREHARLRPGVDRDAPGGPTLSVTDPFGNVLRFCQPSG